MEKMEKNYEKFIKIINKKNLSNVDLQKKHFFLYILSYGKN